eukprot:TRINITY_DN15314_c0_g1_i2.p1 TRINITY_DN15314_c0_g1~~TRINITY_DN15314_c0_g1_i2.p1  ORF type:complete len:255 (-),score=54.22 TRINITY_DN15314_c0_g1_i2:115-849(-)
MAFGPRAALRLRALPSRVVARCQATSASNAAASAASAPRGPASAAASASPAGTEGGASQRETAGTWPLRVGGVLVLVAGAGASWWELRRWQLRQRREEVLERYRESGSESRYPFYGRDHGYEVDYMIELDLQAGDLCHTSFRIETLPLPSALALAAARWRRRSDGAKDVADWIDEVATIEIKDGRRFCRHPPRPGASPAAGPGVDVLTPYSDWLAWPGVAEVQILRKTNARSPARSPAASFTVR